MSAQVSKGSTYPLTTIPSSTSASSEAGFLSHSCIAWVGTVQQVVHRPLPTWRELTRSGATLGTQLIGSPKTTKSNPSAAPRRRILVSTRAASRKYQDS